MNLPEKFIDKMKNLLQDEFNDFLASYENQRQYGLRINTLKIKIEEFQKIAPFTLKPIPWTKDGFFYNHEERPAKHAFYHGGLYYIQEPSAMVPGAFFDVRPGEKVLDLCAAPGGKSLQIAAKLQGEGLLVSNDVSGMRIKALTKNLELYGVKNAVITNEKPERLKTKFYGYFDKILIDAPCSGEGMFRKEPDLMKSWETHGVEVCTVLQKNILEHAQEMLKPGGQILYSTCTFSPEENEMQIANFLERFSDFELISLPKEHGFVGGNPQWGNNNKELEKTIRIWPHKAKGEGHFLALLRKKEKEFDKIKIEKRKVPSSKELYDFYMFVKENLNMNFEEKRLNLQGNNLYYLPIEDIPDLKGLTVIRDGWHLGTIKKNRFEPSQAFAMGTQRKDWKKSIGFSVKDSMLIRYLKGETLEIKGEKGYTLVCVENYPLGLVKQMDLFAKNLYPPGWRWGS